MFLRPFLILEYPLILEIHLKLFEKQHISLVKKAFLIYKKDKALKTGWGDRAHLRTLTPSPHTHTHARACTHIHTRARACTHTHTLRPAKGNYEKTPSFDSWFSFPGMKVNRKMQAIKKFADLIFIRFCITDFPKRLFKHVENRNQSAKIDFVAIKIVIILNVCFAKTRLNTSRALLSVPQNNS